MNSYRFLYLLVFIVPTSLCVASNSFKTKINWRSNIDLANPDKIVAYEDTGLHQAAREGDLAVARRLLLAGATVDIPLAGYRVTPLSLAVTQGQVELMVLFLANGANINAQDSKGKTALLRLLEIIFEQTANPNMHPDHLYYIAPMSTLVEMYDILLARGANLFIQDRNGISPVSISAEIDQANGDYPPGAYASKNQFFIGNQRAFYTQAEFEGLFGQTVLRAYEAYVAGNPILLATMLGVVGDSGIGQPLIDKAKRLFCTYGTSYLNDHLLPSLELMYANHLQ